MIVATSRTFPQGVKIDGLANRGGWFGRTWLVLVGTGFDPLRLVVEAEHESHVIDEIVDSKWGFHLKDDVEPCQVCQERILIEEQRLEQHEYSAADYNGLSGWQQPYWDRCECNFAGDTGELVDMGRISHIERCKVSYFVPVKEKYEYA